LTVPVTFRVAAWIVPLKVPLTAAVILPEPLTTKAPAATLRYYWY
jgi:hypothetical protein